MKHFDLEAWTDYLRGVDAGADRAAQEAHLEACDRCRTQVTALRRVLEDAALEAAHRPPAGIVRSVEAYFSLRKPASRAAWSIVPLAVTFDSATAAPAVGVRNAGRADGRVLVCQSDRYALDLLADHERGGRELVLSGRLVETDAGPVPEVPAVLSAGDQVLSTAVTGPTGEFELRAPAAEAPRLRLMVERSSVLEVELDL